MAKKLDHFDFSVRHRGSRYNWDKFMDGSTWKVRKGDDFTGNPRSFEANLRTKASLSGKKVRVRNIRDTDNRQAIVFQFYGE